MVSLKTFSFLVLSLAVLTFTSLKSAVAVKKPCVDKTAALSAKNSVLDSFFSNLEEIRTQDIEQEKKRRQLNNFLYHSEFVASIPGSLQDMIASELVKPKRLKTSAKDIVLREFDKARPGYDKMRLAGQRLAIIPTLAEWEEQFSPNRVVNLEISADNVPEIMSGKKTLTIREGRKLDVKTGPGVFKFKVRGREREIPITITKVDRVKKIHDLTEADLRAESEHLSKIVDSKGKYEAELALEEALQRFYPNINLFSQITTIYFTIGLH